MAPPPKPKDEDEGNEKPPSSSRYFSMAGDRAFAERPIDINLRQAIVGKLAGVVCVW